MERRTRTPGRPPPLRGRLSAAAAPPPPSSDPAADAAPPTPLDAGCTADWAEAKPGTDAGRLDMAPTRLDDPELPPPSDDSAPPRPGAKLDAAAPKPPAPPRPICIAWPVWPDSDCADCVAAWLAWVVGCSRPEPLPVSDPVTYCATDFAWSVTPCKRDVHHALLGRHDRAPGSWSPRTASAVHPDVGTGLGDAGIPHLDLGRRRWPPR